MKKGPPDHTGYERKGNGGVVMQSLSEVKAGAVCTIKWMFGNPQVMEFMHQHDIREGSTINVFQHGRDRTMTVSSFTALPDMGKRTKIWTKS